MNGVKTVGASEAKTHLSALLNFVACGGEVVITKHSRPVARLVPIEKTAPNKDVFERLRALRGCIKLAKGETIRDLINAGRRF